MGKIEFKKIQHIDFDAIYNSGKTPEEITYLLEAETKRIEKELDEFEKVQELNNKQFEKDLKIMKLCYFLQATKQVFSKGKTTLPLDKHYSWCPHYSWFPDYDENLKKPIF